MTDHINLFLEIVLDVLALAAVVGFVRLLRGPSLPDRVIAFDLLATVGVGISAVYSMAHNQPVFLDVAVVLALISFVGTVAFARYIEKRLKG
ncbi:MAG: cation:proton antiporter [Deltaproteobacteria bacterium]|jgi:multicomponent Na+:H+ antiporter subunit F|nr:cation:proton antiporter [Deltaproteobacteria bacterium]PNV82205.1 MAG: cation:proton antiporter [Desulfobacteraceae bacterium]MDH3772782.1 cation:proton antiporter [Deltaproteobacteria bacterium]MDH3800788.1 cation:proton antiporter [Deltaproteobacteria bacterium]MDH3927335.1 cation:proton antiporter [Deltaproteobacteria bacterium]